MKTGYIGFFYIEDSTCDKQDYISLGVCVITDMRSYDEADDYYAERCNNLLNEEAWRHAGADNVVRHNLIETAFADSQVSHFCFGLSYEVMCGLRFALCGLAPNE